jgi:hypothetical protein
MVKKKLTSKRRNALASKTFALPKERKYPIDTIERARNALARVAQFGTPEEQSRVRRAVKRRFPSVGKK